MMPEPRIDLDDLKAWARNRIRACEVFLAHPDIQGLPTEYVERRQELQTLRAVLTMLGEPLPQYVQGECYYGCADNSRQCLACKAKAAAGATG